MPERGKEYYNLFTETRLKKKDIPCYAPIKKNVIRGFRVVQRKESQKRKIMLMWIGEHLSMSSLPFQQHMKNDQSRESFEIFFLYCSFMFDRCNADRSVHDKSWNKLAEILMSTTNEEKTDTSKENSVCCWSYCSDTISDSNPKNVSTSCTEVDNCFTKRIPTICFSYRFLWKHSIKEPERAKTGSTKKIIIILLKSEVPRDFSEFFVQLRKQDLHNWAALSNNKNNYCSPNTLRTPQMILLHQQECVSLKLIRSLCSQLLWNNEEADITANEWKHCR